MSASVKKNFLYSSILVVSNYLFPIIIFPYVSRVLGVTNIGICNYVDSIINYFIIFSMMGVSILGIRDIAASKDNKMEMSRTFFSLLYLNTITTIIAAIGLVVAIFTVESLYEYRLMLFVSLFKLIGNLMLVEWFFKGLEDFKFITNRTIIVRFAYVAALFIFVRKPEDYVNYYVLTVLMVFINAILNILYGIKKIQFNIGYLAIKKYIKPNIYLGAYMILTNMYVSFNIVYLGFVCGPTEVGYYTTATKLHTIILAFFTAFTGVLMPRMSSLLSQNKLDEFRLMVTKSTDILIAISLPVVLLTTIFSPQIITILAGGDFSGAILPARIIMPLLFIIGYEQILVIQILLPSQKDSIVFRNAIIGAVLGTILNVTLVPEIKSVGSAIVWLSSEVVILCLSQQSVKNFLNLSFPLVGVTRNIIAYCPLIIALLIVYHISGEHISGFIVGSVLTGIYFILIQTYYLRNDFVLSLFTKYLRRKF